MKYTLSPQGIKGFVEEENSPLSRPGPAPYFSG